MEWETAELMAENRVYLEAYWLEHGRLYKQFAAEWNLSLATKSQQRDAVGPRLVFQSKIG